MALPNREAVGSLNFLAIVSRPDIAFAVSVVSRFLNKFDSNYWNAVKRIIKYLIETRDLKITYSFEHGNNSPVAYSGADYAGDVDTRRSTSGFLIKLVNGPIVWGSQRQNMVTLIVSTTEAEYVAASVATKRNYVGKTIVKRYRISI